MVRSASGLPVPIDVRAVSLANPGAEATSVMAKCQIGSVIPTSEVVGMGKIDSVKDVVRFINLTGREPQLNDEGPAWIVQIKGDLHQPTGQIWTDPTCVVTTGDFGWYGTGAVTDVTTGKVTQPLPVSVAPDLGLPQLVP